MDRKACSERIYDNDGRRYRPCTRPATANRPTKVNIKVAEARMDTSAVYEGGEPVRIPAQYEERLEDRWYCGTHDPVAITARKDKKRAERRAEREKVVSQDTGARAVADQAIARLKECGIEATPEYRRNEWGPDKHRTYPTGRVVITARDVDTILDAMRKEA